MLFFTSINLNFFQVFPFAYKHVFKFIEENIVSLICASFTTDYELAMRNALKQMYPHVKRFACYFHFTQAVKKRAYQTTGLVVLIFSNEKAKSVYYRLQCLPLLSPEHIKPMFIELKDEAMRINKQVFKPFIKYFQNQWIEKID